MDRSRYRPSDTYTRRDDGRHGNNKESRESGRTYDLFLKFRDFRPYLKARLKKIEAENRRDLRDEIEDIKFFLGVMSDMMADENHGAESLQEYIDRIHEMIRKNPLAEEIPSYQVVSDQEEEDNAAPRSPSPTEIQPETFAGPPTTARTIPLERPSEFSQFDDVEEVPNPRYNGDYGKREHQRMDPNYDDLGYRRTSYDASSQMQESSDSFFRRSDIRRDGPRENTFNRNREPQGREEYRDPNYNQNSVNRREPEYVGRESTFGRAREPTRNEGNDLDYERRPQQGFGRGRQPGNFNSDARMDYHHENRPSQLWNTSNSFGDSDIDMRVYTQQQQPQRQQQPFSMPFGNQPQQSQQQLLSNPFIQVQAAQAIINQMAAANPIAMPPSMTNMNFPGVPQPINNSSGSILGEYPVHRQPHVPRPVAPGAFRHVPNVSQPPQLPRGGLLGDGPTTPQSYGGTTPYVPDASPPTHQIPFNPPQTAERYGFQDSNTDSATLRERFKSIALKNFNRNGPRNKNRENQNIPPPTAPPKADPPPKPPLIATNQMISEPSPHDPRRARIQMQKKQPPPAVPQPIQMKRNDDKQTGRAPNSVPSSSKHSFHNSRHEPDPRQKTNNRNDSQAQQTSHSKHSSDGHSRPPNRRDSGSAPQKSHEKNDSESQKSHSKQNSQSHQQQKAGYRIPKVPGRESSKNSPSPERHPTNPRTSSQRRVSGSGDQRKVLQDKVAAEKQQSEHDPRLRPKKNANNVGEKNAVVNGKTSKKTSSSSQKKDAEVVPQKSTFRIPKIARPPEPPPPKSPEPEPIVAPSPPRIPSESEFSQTSTGSIASPASKSSDTLEIFTDDFIKQFVLKEMGSSKGPSMLEVPGALQSIREKMREKLNDIFLGDGSKTKSDLSPPKSPAKDSVEEGAEEEEGADVHDEIEPGGHRSRSPTKKRNSKRRSSLDKLHAALNEMNFDAMLPLGPRRCKANTPSSNSDTPTKSSEGSKRSKTPSTSSAVSDPMTSSLNESQEGVVSPPPKPQKRGTKRTASQPKGNKSKRPATARNIVKNAKKTQKNRKRVKTPVAGGRNANNTRHTRSKAQAEAVTRLTVLDTGNLKVKTEVKEEPADRIDDDCLTAGTGLEHMEEDQVEINFEAVNEIMNDPPAAATPRTEIVFDTDGASVDIKLEPMDIVEDRNIDTDYGADVTDFLPDIPTIENVFSCAEEEEAPNTMNTMLNQIEKQQEEGVEDGNTVTTANDDDIKKDCFHLMDSLLNDVEDQEVVCQIPAADEEGESDGDASFPEDIDSDESEELNDFYDTTGAELALEETSKRAVDTPATAIEPPADSMEIENTVLEVNLNMVKKEEADDSVIIIDEEEDALEDDSEGMNPPQTSHSPVKRSKQRAKGAPPDPITAEFRLPNCDPTILDPEAQAGRITNIRGHLLYKCPNTPCEFSAVNSIGFKDHVMGCMFATDNKSIGCPHCDKRVKLIGNLLEHLKIHGRQKQLCSICPYRTWATSELVRHLKSFHKVYNHKVEKFEFVDPEEDPDFVWFAKDVAARVCTPEKLKEGYASYADRLVYGPEEIDKIPNRQIFQTLAYCGACSYSSKVRVNFTRHLKAHLKAAVKPEVLIPSTDPVNPVPCLERKELMFDKMTNWAGSTHEPKTGNSCHDSSSCPQFIPEQFRYICCVQGCEQITVDEYLLRTHIRTLHPEVDQYKCSHCEKHEGTRHDHRNIVPVDKLGAHLKLHGPKLYRCAYCDVVHTQLILMEKHIPEKHPERKPIHYLIRNLDTTENNPPNRRNSNDEVTANDKWRCTLCASKQAFGSYQDVKSHCLLTHKIGSQFVCDNCKYCTDNNHLICSHVLKCKRSPENEGKILVMWYRSEFELKPEDIVHGPLWKRSSVKHIRGIFLEDGKEKFHSASSGMSFVSSPLKHRKPRKPALSDSSIGEPVVLTCPKCNLFKTKNVSNMRVHLYNELGYQRYRCNKCNVEFVTESSLKGHITGDHKIPFSPSSFELLPTDPEIEDYVNGFFATQEKVPDDSVKLEGEGGSIESLNKVGGVFRCKHCKQECQSPHNLRTHVLAKHLASDRYSCGHCKSTFWNKSLVRKHHANFHKELDVQIEEEYQVDTSPDFWDKEYGIPPTLKKSPKKSVQVDTERDPPSTSTATSIESEPGMDKIPADFDLAEEDGMLFDFADKEAPVLDDDVLEIDLANGGMEDSLFQQFSEERSITAGNSNARTKQNSVTAFKCFHCGENSLSLRGARSHWEKVHSTRREERCNYFEYKSFNSLNELPPCMQLVCSVCDYTVSCLSLMHDHHDMHHATLPFRMKRKLRVGTTIFECAICFHECSTKEQVLEHGASVHSMTENHPFTTSDIRDKMEDNDSNLTFMGKLVEDIVRYTCEDPSCAFEFDTRSESQSHMLSEHGILSRKVNIKYNRYILNPKIKVPMEEVEAVEPTIMYQCPVCKFQAENRQKLVMDHLGEHVHTYICPSCPLSFRSYVDTKFHIRIQHADPHGTPLINREMVKAREGLENSIIQVHANLRRPS